MAGVVSAKTKVDFRNLRDDIRDLNNIDMRRIGIKTLELNEDQISKKTNKDNTKFKPYSASYAKRKGVSQGAVDLVSKASVRAEDWSPPNMLTTFGLKRVTKRTAEVGVSSGGPSDRAKSVSDDRPFIGLTKRNRQKLLKFASKILLD